MLSQEQLIQEDDYEFPYHYIADLDLKGGSLSRRWGWAVNYLGRIELVTSILKQKNFSAFCDIGCGDGRLVNILSDAFPQKSFLGIDYSKRAIRLAMALNNATNADFRCIDILTEDILNPFDGISLVEVLEHIPPPLLSKFMERATTFLKQNGFAIITVPSKNTPLIKKHFQHFDLGQIRAVVEQVGLRVEEARYIDGSDFAFRVMRKLIYNQLVSIESPMLTRMLVRYYRKNLLWDQPGGNGVYLFCVKP